METIMNVPVLTLMTALVGFAASVRAQEIGSVESGRKYAALHCAGCHAIDPDDSHFRNPRAAPFREIAETPGMNGRALTVWLTSTHKDMPNLIIERDDMEDLIAYILSLKRGKQPDD
jgi:mono/diheme cytochrome c family protein